MKLTEQVEIQGVIECISGLKIGGTKETAGIGETDNPIIRHPITRLPYIPGSSLKGKMRSLLEWKYREECQITGRACSCGKCEICEMFGSNNIKTAEHPSRLIFRDAQLTDESRCLLEKALPGTFIEDKTEIAMNRKKGAALDGALRQQERVPAGTKFSFSISMRVFDIDKANKEKYRDFLNEAISMLEKDYLGGSGTRGYGKVKFLKEDGKTPLIENSN